MLTVEKAAIDFVSEFLKRDIDYMEVLEFIDDEYPRNVVNFTETEREKVFAEVNVILRNVSEQFDDYKEED